MRNKSQILVKNDGNGPFFILFWPFSHIFAQFLRMRKLKMTRGKYFCTLNITYYLQYYILVKDFWFFWLKSKRTLVRVDFQKNWKFGSRAHLKKTREISIFLIGVSFRRTIFFGPVVLDVFLDGASIESIKFTKKSHHGLLKCEKPRKTAFFGHFRPIFTVFWTFFKIGSNDFV